MKAKNSSNNVFGTKPIAFDGESNPYDDENATSVFRSSYPSVRSYVPGNAASLFANARQSGKMPIVSKKAREVLPGMYTFDFPYLAFLRDFTESLNAKLRPEIDSEGFSLNGLHETFDSVRTVAGYPQMPVSALPRDNSALRRDLGLQDKMNPKQIKIAKMLMHRVFRRIYPKAIRVPKNSTSGPVRNVSDEVYKLHFALWIFSNNRFEDYLNCFASGDLNRLVREFDACIMFGTNVRWQVDTPGKERDYWDTRDILKDNAPHKRKITTKVVIDGLEYPDFAAMRTRMINQGPWTVNALLQPLATGIMQTMFHDFGATWYPDETAFGTMFEGKHIVAYDVGSYDHSFSAEQIDLTHECLAEFVDPRLVALSRQLYTAAYFTRPIGDPKEGFRATVVGDPFNYLEDQIHAGNRSGHAFTSVMAKLWKPIDTLCKLDAIGVNVIDNFDDILTGKFHCGFINNGDDEVVWFNEQTMYGKFKKYVETIPSPDKMFNVEVETGCVFSGKVLQLVGDKSYKPVERIPGTFQRMLCPERSIGGRMRPAWPIGILDRYNRRSEHDVKEEAFRIFDFEYRKHLEPVYGGFHHLVEIGMKSMPIQAEGLTWIDRQVLDDPAKIHYRFKPEDVSDNVLELTFSKLQPKFFEHFLRSCYSGDIML